MNDTIKVRVFFPGYTSTGSMTAICKTFGIKDFTHEHITFVDDSSYTHAIIINWYSKKDNPKIKQLPKKNILGIAWEPPILLRRDNDIKDYAEKHIGKFLIGQNLKGYPKCYTGYYSFISHIPIQDKPDKTEFMSIIVSNKKYLQGHKYRHELVQAILKTNLNIHIYGVGSNEYNDERVRGKFIRMEPYKDYMFTIAIENKIYNHYITEKITSAFSLNCIPIYLGCPNIKKYFGDNCHIKLNGNVNDDIKLLHDIFNNKDKYLLNLDGARNHILTGNASLPVFLSKYWKK